MVGNWDAVETAERDGWRILRETTRTTVENGVRVSLVRSTMSMYGSKAI